MQFTVTIEAAEQQPLDCLIVGVFENDEWPSVSQRLDVISKGALQSALKSGDINGKNGQTLLLYQVPGIQAKRVLLLGLGKTGELNTKQLAKAMRKAFALLDEGGTRTAGFVLPEKRQCSIYAATRTLVIACEDARYCFNQCKTQKKPKSTPLQQLTLFLPKNKHLKAAQAGITHGLAIAKGIKQAKDLANLPGNICTPSYLAKQARKLKAQSKHLKVHTLNEKDMKKLGMGALLSVSKGSREPAYLIVMEYQGADAATPPLVLVGKGLTFDAGGISLKPSERMDEMKYDMSGGASVFGVMRACMALELPINLVGLVPASENLPDGKANKPGDIVTSMAGLTIEVLNTDAEGRLILCDALTYAKRFKPAAVVDIATLTGACVVALGHHISGLLGNDDTLARELESAGEAIDDPVWRLPMNEDYQEQLKSPFADLANIGGRSAGTITAACFLSRFTEDYPWAHLDIAGTAWKSGNDKGATGRPVALLTNWLLQRCGLTR